MLVEHCLECHSASAKELKGSLALDTSAGVRAGGDTGPAIVAGKPGESLLIEVVRYANPDLQMPPKAKLSPEAIADLEQWIKLGGARSARCQVPRHFQTSELTSTAAASSGRSCRQRDASADRAGHGWAANEIDRFVLARLEAQELTPVADADRRTLLRRVYSTCSDCRRRRKRSRPLWQTIADAGRRLSTSCSPRRTSASAGAATGSTSPATPSRTAADARFSRNPSFPHAWRYRDYVIRAVNADMPYDRFISEQIAGDLLPAEPPAERPSSSSRPASSPSAPSRRRQ